MKQFTSIHDVDQPDLLLEDALLLKKQPLAYKNLGQNKTLGLIFMNPSFRTRLSTQKAAMNLGMQVIVLNITSEGWKLEMQDGAVMNSDTVEHVKDAAAIMGLYCDVVGLRCFPSLTSRENDYGEQVLGQFQKYCKAPIISLESGTLHPLQSFADLITITEHWHKKEKPKVVLSWAPHIKALPQAVPNSFAQWMGKADVDLVIANPEGYDLCEEFSTGARVTHQQEEALENADFVYIKNWSSYADYGAMPAVKKDWLLSEQKLQASNNAYIMHCLPVRRNVEAPDALLDGDRSLILQQAENRIYAAQAVLKHILLSNTAIS